MIPTVDTTHVADGLNLLIGEHRGKPGIAGILQAVLQEVQVAENVSWDVIDSKILANNPTGQALYQLADLIGCPRGTLTDAELLVVIPIWLLARKSKGRSEDLIQILAKAFGDSYAQYVEWFPAAYAATVLDAPDAGTVGAIANALTIARPPGVYGVLTWTTFPTSTLFYLAGPVGSGIAGSGFISPTGVNPRGLAMDSVV
jgi:hypothetical protein